MAVVGRIGTAAPEHRKAKALASNSQKLSLDILNIMEFLYENYQKRNFNIYCFI